jgi:hypothetical protein
MTATSSQKLSPQEAQPRRVNTTINRIIDGRTENYGQVTLTAGATSTTVATSGLAVSENSVIALSPRTANAAAALATTYVSAVANGSFTLTHANNAQTDRTFDFAWIG